MKVKDSDNSLWSGIIGQDDALERIIRSLDFDDRNHAWLFAGPRGVGKWTTAKVLASALNCQDRGCGKCIACSKVMRELHPDIYMVEPEGNFILIEQIDELLRSVALKNFEGQVKVIIIDDVDKMTMEAANSLLKTLEEPPPGVVFILISSNMEAVLPTIISRCRIVQFKSLPLEDMVLFLTSRYMLSGEEAELASKLSGGILGAALSFAMSPSRKERRMSVLNIAQKIDRADLADVSFMAETLMRELKRPLDELKARQKMDMDEMKEKSGQTELPSGVKRKMEQRQKRESSHEESQGFMDILSVLASWYRDIMLFQETGKPEMLVNRDQIQLIIEYSGVLTSSDACKCLEAIEETRQYSRFNVNMQLAFETMLFKIHDVVSVRDASYF